MKAELYCVCGNVSQFPEETLPEIAFAGKSNVGKSSLINSLTGRHGSGRNGLARTSRQPGKTRTINWYLIEGKMYFVDLPGYGFARTSKQEQASWARLTETYLNQRRSLKLVLVLVDIRNGPGQNDLLMQQYLESTGLPYRIAATKADKLSKAEFARRKKEISQAMSVREDQLLCYSSLSGQGRGELWQTVRAAALSR